MLQLLEVVPANNEESAIRNERLEDAREYLATLDFSPEFPVIDDAARMPR